MEKKKKKKKIGRTEEKGIRKSFPSLAEARQTKKTKRKTINVDT